MLSKYGLDKATYSERKVVKESVNSKRWGNAPKEINLINQYHFTPVRLRSGYRAGHNIIRGARWILIDVDEKGDNVEEKLREYKLHFIKAPSGSATDEITHKWHYFVKTKKLSRNVAIARSQLQEFYTALGLVNVDTSSIDPARYFAPCGCAEVYGTDEWKTRLKWCNENTVIVEGNKWIPADEDDITPIYSGSGTPVYLTNLDTVNAPEFDESGDYVMKMTKPKKSGGGYSFDEDAMTYRLDPKNKIYTTEGWSTLGAIGAALSDGETVSNLFGCPVHNMDHSKDPKTIGYGYATRKGDAVFFSCGGNECKKKCYYIYYKEVK